MAYSDTFNFVTGDTLPALTLTLKDKNTAASGAVLDPDNSDTWDAIDLTSSTVLLRLRKVGETALTDTRTMIITNPTAGKCETNFATTTFATSGTYEGEVEITYTGSGAKQTVHELVKFKVREDFD